MPFVSIKKYLDVASSVDYRPTLDLLAEIATEHGIAFNPAQHELFRCDVASILGRLNGPVDKEQFTTAVGAIGQALRRHNQAVGTLIGHQSAELQNMVIMLTQSIRSLGSASDASTRNLEEIAVQIRRASTLEDVSQLRKRLSECLERLKNETARQKDENQRKLQALNANLSESQHRLAQYCIAADVDQITGFAGRRTAEGEVHKALASNDSWYLLVAALESLPTINAIFGYDTGDEILAEFAAGLAANLRRPAAIYRWRGPAIVGLLHRPGPIGVVRTEVGRAVAASPTSAPLANPSGPGYAQSTAASLLLPVVPPAATLFAKIDEFVATRVHETKR